MRIFSCNTDINFEAKALKFNKIIELSARTVTGQRVRCDTLVNALNMTPKRTWRLLLVKETPKQQWPLSEAEVTILDIKLVDIRQLLDYSWIQAIPGQYHKDSSFQRVVNIQCHLSIEEISSQYCSVPARFNGLIFYIWPVINTM